MMSVAYIDRPERKQDPSENMIQPAMSIGLSVCLYQYGPKLLVRWLKH